MKRHLFKEVSILVLIFIFFVTLGYLFPYTNDDWAWGSSIGIDRLNSFFVNYNGRYLGNLLVILLTRFRVIRALLMGAFLTLIVFLINKNIKNSNKTTLIFAALSIVLLPKPIFRQAIAWTSGFSNYVPPILLCLVWLYLSRNLFLKREITIKNIWAFPVLILGICSCLFMEHVSLYLTILAFAGIIYCLKQKIKINLSQITYLLGTLIGLVFMFQNEAYHHVVVGDDFYRNVHKDNIIIQSIKRYFYTIYDNLFLNNTIILIIIACCCVFLFFKFIYKKKDIKHIKLLTTSLSVIVFYAVYSLGSCFFSEWEKFVLIFKALEGLLTIMYFFALVIFLLLVPTNISKDRLFFYLISIIVMTLPLLVVSPVTPRCFYPMYVLWCVFVLQLLCDCFKYIKSDFFFKVINYFGSSMLLVSMFYYLCIIFSAFYVTNQMIEYIKYQKSINSQEYILPKTVYEDYMKHPYPHDDTNMNRFKLFYNIDKRVKITFIDYEQWNSIIKISDFKN